MLMLMVAMIATAKDIKTVIFTTTPQMHCANCEAKVKNNLRFAKGVKEIKTSVEEQKVYVTYDAQKTNEEKLRRLLRSSVIRLKRQQRRLKSLFTRTKSARICNR